MGWEYALLTRVPLPDRELVFESRPRFEGHWIEEDRLLEFRCELRSTHPDHGRVLARVRARLAASWMEGLRILGREVVPSGFVLDRVEDLDLAVALNGERVFERTGDTPKREDYSLIVPLASGGRVRLTHIVYCMRRCLKRMDAIRTGGR